MPKTIKQIANEIGVSKQAVHQRIKYNKELQQSLQPFMSTIDGTIYIDVDGEKIIKTFYSNAVSKQTINVDDKVDINVDTVDTNVDVKIDKKLDTIIILQNTIELLKQQLNIKDNQLLEKDKQLAEKDKQIENLNAILTISQQTIADTTSALTTAQALHAGTIQKLSIQTDNTEVENIEENKKNIFKRIFKKK